MAVCGCIFTPPPPRPNPPYRRNDAPKTDGIKYGDIPLDHDKNQGSC
ncbi:unnamed protein product [Penicillium nalgiovense]|nr:unnamed protein product [Penicillium nalgiovense]